MTTIKTFVTRFDDGRFVTLSTDDGRTLRIEIGFEGKPPQVSKAIDRAAITRLLAFLDRFLNAGIGPTYADFDDFIASLPSIDKDKLQ